MVPPTLEKTAYRPLERWGTFIIMAFALLLGLTVLWRSDHHPRTDDAEVFANFIGIAPQVEGPILQLNVRDNQFVKKGDLLFAIDSRPYQYAYERTLSLQAILEGQIQDEQRRIAAQVSGVSVAKAGIDTAEADVKHWAAAIEEANADVTHAEQGVARAKAEWTYASDNLQRLEPLLQRQFVTVDQVDRARSVETAQAEALKQAQSQLVMAQAEVKSAAAQYSHAVAAVEQSHAQHQQAQHSVLTLDPLISQRGERAAETKTARYNLDNCAIYAPFDAFVTNLTISEGEYAHVGQQVFVLIDARKWWVLANFREGQLRHIRPGMAADVYILSRPHERFQGVVDSIGFGVTPDADVLGHLGPGLPDVQRTLNWVHLAARYPVRIRVENPPRDLFRIGETAVTTIRGY
ncbi:multidrug efflux system membrane fusion protein [Silvibacterium bohemicum]|uniref:Multidrug efflux system membrane fusion protein n=1 Tax=Silvibacterium bohemicum TaxID=1577686 RepID=A0A841JZH5_9BACT|nr:efflux RND transporter periplasmic adaptor subunit [Silvibacterium bohemicum]MBB6146762.1 multidrug efflux system membrane fusion protein [Silvibacterium bohemicum]